MAIDTLAHHIKTRLSILLVSGFLLSTSTTVLAQTASDFLASPPVITPTASPLVMFTMSNDHQLYIKAYTDYSDLNNDGVLDRSYNDVIEYSGYFDSLQCYLQESDVFVPKGAAGGVNGHSCTSKWSGNFLNWATMTRIDILRHVLYGGKRSTDSTTETILERAVVPRDAHAFVKVFTSANLDDFTPYDPSDVIDQTISICNVSDNGLVSGKPEMRVATGAWPFWSADEGTQCQWKGNGSSPNEFNTYTVPNVNDSKKLDEHYVYVKACSDDYSALNDTRCRIYPNGKAKPVGLLQEYSEDSSLRFGLVTGSYNKNKSGGVLRSQLRKIVGTGQPTADEINLTDGTFNHSSVVNGIIESLDAFTISQYTNGYSGCSASGSFSDGNCKDWANPLAEMYLETLRYMSGAQSGVQLTPTPSYNANDSSIFPELTQINTWEDPYLAADNCSKCSIIVISTGLNSYDTDQLSGLGDIKDGGSTLSQTTLDGYLDNIITSNEGVSGNYFIGNNGASVDERCTSKNVTGLSTLKGICPEIPADEGGYHIAGLAYHAKTHDLRGDVDLSGEQTVDTYTIALAESLPSFAFPIDGRNVSFSPICQDRNRGGTICSIVNVIVDDQLLDGSNITDNQRGAFTIAWEDAERGSDYDKDAIVRIEYCVGASCAPVVNDNQVRFTMTEVNGAAGHTLDFGYTISGVYDIVGDYNSGTHYGLTWRAPNTGSTFTYNSNTEEAGVWQRTYTVDTTNSAAKTLKNPLWYAAKYGSFNDLDGSGTPNSPDEWDIKNITGEYIADGIPDSYFPVSNPANLKAALSRIFQNITDDLVSSSAAAVVSNASNGVGAIFQGLYYPSYRASASDEVSWVGMMQAIFRDENGYLREDTIQDGVLGNYDEDYRIEIYYDEIFERSRIQRYQLKSGADLTEIDDGDFEEKDKLEIEKFNPIWNARNELAKLNNGTQIKTQRTYSAPADTGRYIFTGIDADKSGLVESSEVFDFDETKFPAVSSDNNYRYLGLDSTTYTQAPNIINFIRGYDGISGYRTRAVDYDGLVDMNGDKAEEIWRLGDIIHSEPASVSRPNANYDTRYGDETYRAFRQHYTYRRQVLYVGGNDGMLHAFNAGFYNSATQSFDTAKPDDTDAVQHPLGSELWGYVPMNVLPHLRWLTAPDYQHVYYVDGSPRVYDVNIFDKDDEDHPGGWGTILVVGMRLGGGDITLDPDSDADGDSTDDITARSAFIVMDITNPEKPPELIAEIAYTPDGTDFGYTTSKPVVVKRRVASDSGGFESPNYNQWLMVLGSGPQGASAGGTLSERDALSEMVSGKDAKVFVFDLQSKAFVSDFSVGSNSYVGNIAKVDWDKDYTDDAVYFGTVAGTALEPNGSLQRLGIDFSLPADSLLTNLLVTDANDPTTPDTIGPIVNTPRMEKDDLGNQWIYAGTGRYLTSEDSSSTVKQYFYGVIENKPDSTVTTLDMVNVTDFQVFTMNPESYFSENIVVRCEWPCAGGLISGSAIQIEDKSGARHSIRSWQTLQAAISKTNGWYREFAMDEAGTSAGRSLGPTNLIGPTLLFVEYAPSDDQCMPIGYSRLFAVDYQTGTASPYAVAGISDDVDDLAKINFGQSNNLNLLGGDGEGDSDNNDGDGTIGDQYGGSKKPKIGATPYASGRRSWKEINIDWNIGF